MKLRFSAPTETVWIVAVAAGVLGLLINFRVLSLSGISAFVLVAAGFVILAIAPR